MCPATGEAEVFSTRHELASRDVDPYSEQEIRQVAAQLLRDGKNTWSQNPRLYIILRDIGQIEKTIQPQLLDKLINDGFNDFWIPVVSRDILQQILPRNLHSQFLRTQDRVCVQPVDFRIGLGNFHGHFTAKDGPPFASKRGIGSGHVGDVDEVLSLIDGQVYARKSIRKLSRFSRAQDDVQKFRSELQALSRIKYKHCVEIVGSYTNPHHLAMIMSPVADCNLKDYLLRAEASTERFYTLRIREWFGCLATAVQYLHTNKIRHRDIKPANILVHGANILLVDLELALDWKDLEQSTTTTYCGNTPLYAAPEVIERRKCNSTTDIWSLGCVFLEMATVVKGKSISALRQHFYSQTNSSLFYHNPKGISEWISHLADVFAEDNVPLLWISSMLQPDRTIRARATTIVDQIHASHTGTSRPNPYFGQCCQQYQESADLHIPLCLLCGTLLKVSPESTALCTRCKKTYRQSRIYRNPETIVEILPVQLLISYLHPSFMIQHLTPNCMESFTRSVVVEDGWGPSDVGVRLSCLPGQSLHLNVRRFVPSYHLYSIQMQHNSNAVSLRYSLPVGIYDADPERMARSFSIYLDDIIDKSLIAYASFMIKLLGTNNSSRTLMVMCTWLKMWKHELPDHLLLLIKNALKLVAIQTILQLGLFLEDIPSALQKSALPGYHGPQPYSLHNQSPRLLNRQVKVAFFLVYQTLLSQVLTNFKYLAPRSESWSTPLFISLCLALLLERIEVASQEYLFVAKNIYRDEEGSIDDIKEYCGEVDIVIFDRIYRVLSSMSISSCSESRVMDREFFEALRGIPQQSDSEAYRTLRADVRVKHSSRLVSALLDLVPQV